MSFIVIPYIPDGDSEIVNRGINLFSQPNAGENTGEHFFANLNDSHVFYFALVGSTGYWLSDYQIQYRQVVYNNGVITRSLTETLNTLIEFQARSFYCNKWDSILIDSNIHISLTPYESESEMLSDIYDFVKYPITYSATNGTVTGPVESAVGETVLATGTPNVNYGITDYTTQITVTCNDIPVPFTFNATTNEITFIMPDPTSS